jgi:chemotaxis protein MotB
MKTGTLCVLTVLSLVLIGCGGRDLEAENRELQSELADARAQHQETQARLDELTNQNNQMLERLRSAGQDITDLSEARAALETQIAELRRREEAQRQRLASLRSMVSQFHDMIASGQLRVRIVRGKMVVELPEGVLFDSGRADLREEGQSTLQQVAQVLAQIPNREFLVAGHTDNVPMRSRRFPSNWELSAARGVVVARFLAENGMPANRIAAAGYADTQPVSANDTDEGRAQNRRIEIVLMPNLDELPDLSALEDELESPTPAAAPTEVE